jgi:Ca2+-binding EF-hand superfamily protein
VKKNGFFDFLFNRQNRLRPDQVNELKEAFSLFDGDGDGFVTIEEVNTALEAMGKDFLFK